MPRPSPPPDKQPTIYCINQVLHHEIKVSIWIFSMAPLWAAQYWLWCWSMHFTNGIRYVWRPQEMRYKEGANTKRACRGHWKKIFYFALGTLGLVIEFIIISSHDLFDSWRVLIVTIMRQSRVRNLVLAFFLSRSLPKLITSQQAAWQTR